MRPALQFLANNTYKARAPCGSPFRGAERLCRSRAVHPAEDIEMGVTGSWFLTNLFRNSAAVIEPANGPLDM